METKTETINAIENSLKKLGIENPKVSLTYPTHIEMGDYTTNVAMMYAKELGRNPLELALEIKEDIVASDIRHIKRIDVIKPGFINFFFDEHYFSKTLESIVSSKYGKNTIYNNQKTIIEYTVCNVLKPMHIGHLMGNVIGESISRLVENAGAIVKRNNYQGDSGLHIAKAVWGIIKQGGIVDGNISEKTEYIGKAYTLGANSYEDDPQSAGEIKELNKKIFEKSDSELNKVYEWGRKVSLEHFEELYKKLGTKFDYYFFESEVADNALKIVREFLANGVFEESEGAVVFKGENYDSKLHTRVFISSQGIPMYEAKDIAHAIRKYDTYKFDKSIIITANEQSEYFKVVFRALKEINPEIADKTQHIAHGILKLSTGKMSSRKGNVITGETLIDDVENLVRERIVGRDFSDAEKNEIAEVVAVGAIKYSILRQAIGGDIVFDFDKSLSFEGDSGPYLQYSVVRANSILNKVADKSFGTTDIPENWQTTNLERLLERFPSVVEKAGLEYGPHYLVTYLTELAGEFNSFYASGKIISEEADSEYKISLVQRFSSTMSQGLDLIGIKVPNRM